MKWILVKIPMCCTDYSRIIFCWKDTNEYMKGRLYRGRSIPFVISPSLYGSWEQDQLEHIPSKPLSIWSPHFPEGKPGCLYGVDHNIIESFRQACFTLFRLHLYFYHSSGPFQLLLRSPTYKKYPFSLEVNGLWQSTQMTAPKHIPCWICILLREFSDHNPATINWLHGVYFRK